MKHNISITVDQKLFREIENTRGREKRSTFIEYLIASGLKNHKNQPPQTHPPYASARIAPANTTYLA